MDFMILNGIFYSSISNTSIITLSV